MIGKLFSVVRSLEKLYIIENSTAEACCLFTLYLSILWSFDADYKVESILDHQLLLIALLTFHLSLSCGTVRIS